MQRQPSTAPYSGGRPPIPGKRGNGYRILSMDGVGVGGLMALPPGAAEAGMRPGWLGYLSVADVDRSIASIVAAGGAEQMAAMDIAGVGRIAMVADPQGASLYVMTPSGDGPATSFLPGRPGHGGWHQLHTNDCEAALTFYRAQFGWRKSARWTWARSGACCFFVLALATRLGGCSTIPKRSAPTGSTFQRRRHRSRQQARDGTWRCHANGSPRGADGRVDRSSP